MELNDRLPMYQQSPFNAELLDAAGGLMINNFFDISDEQQQYPGGSYIPR